VAPGPETHRAALAALGLGGPALARLEAYLDLLAQWSRRINLTGARTAEERVALLVAEVLPAGPLVDAGSLLDVGSGNGSPGLVLALLRDELDVTLLEPRARRWAFLREAVRVTGRERVEVLRLRHDAYRGPPARTLTLRGLRLPLSELQPLVAPGGRVLLFGPGPAEVAPFSLEEERPVPRGRLRVLRAPAAFHEKLDGETAHRAAWGRCGRLPSTRSRRDS
jgi:16S rRNA (guanine527-N7)-methyltransferase